MEMAVKLRLNELIKYDVNNEPIPFVVLSTETEKALYEAVINNYMWAYINQDSYEQFQKLFSIYWKININKYSELFNRASELYEKLFKFRDGLAHYAKDEKTQKVQSKTETFSPEETSTHTYDHTFKTNFLADKANNYTDEKHFTQNAAHTETNSDTQTTYKYGDINDKGDKITRGGKNTTKTEYSGEPDKFTADNTNTETYSDFDVDKFVKALKSMTVYDSFIDAFAPLFQEVLYYV